MRVAHRSSLPFTLILSLMMSSSRLVAQPKEPNPTLSSSKRSTSSDLIDRGVITRRELAPYLQQGPQPIIASVRVLPTRVKGRFAGFKLVMIAPGSPAERAGLQVGDVLFAVNDVSLERPQQVMTAWESLSQAHELKLSLRRGADALTYRWILAP